MTCFEAKDGAGFESDAAGPVPPDYVLGPGDSVRVQLYGNKTGIYEYEVTRDGILNLPELGPVTVAGLSFTEFRKDVNRRVEQMLLGTQVSVTMGRLHSIQVFALGDVNRPGSYLVGGLGTISSALYRSGGVSRVGTLRDIQLKRGGKTVAHFDLYDALLKGDTSDDHRLQSGDVIFVPPIGLQVSVSGAVKRPAVYELRGQTSIGDAIRMAGGLLPDAYPKGARIERIKGNEERRVLSLDVGDEQQAAMLARAGDVVIVPHILPQFEETVTLIGHVHRPGPHQWRTGMRLSDLITSELALQPGADSGYVLIRRENAKTRYVSAISANLSDALANPELAGQYSAAGPRHGACFQSSLRPAARHRFAAPGTEASGTFRRTVPRSQRDREKSRRRARIRSSPACGSATWYARVAVFPSRLMHSRPR